MKVFVSHSFADQDLAKHLADGLKASGFEVWDESHVLPGDNWGESLAQALRDSEAMVVLLTPNAMHAPNVNLEVGYALGKKDYKGRVVPVLAAPPEQLSPEQIPWVLRRMVMIDLAKTGPEEGVKRIVQALQEAA